MSTGTAAPEKGKAPQVPAKTGTPPVAGDSTKVPQSIAEKSKAYTEIVEAKVQQFLRAGQLHLPNGYSAENAMKSAYLILQGVVDKDGKPALEVCTRESIANSLLDMIVQGLNPAKKQGYFIVYGKTLTFQRSYMGSMAVAQMVNPDIRDWGFAVVYEGDTFKYGIKNGKKAVSEHTQDIASVKKEKIVAAYSIALDKNGEPMKTEIATFDEIKQAWRQSKMNPFDEKGAVKDSSTHGKFTADMALKTVINKNCKIIINSSSDNALLLERINRNEDLADSAAARVEIDEHANTGEVLEITADAGKPEAGASKETPAPGPDDVPPALPACTCDQMLKEGYKEFSCPEHGDYANGRFTKRKPGY